MHRAIVTVHVLGPDRALHCFPIKYHYHRLKIQPLASVVAGDLNAPFLDEKG
jgi:hypothetical protein